MKILFLILIIISFQNFAQSKEVKWKLKNEIKHDSYIEETGTGFTKMFGTNKKIKLRMTEYTPRDRKMNPKEFKCKKWRAQEITYKKKYVVRSYSLNDCLPCLDKGAGHMCSYPYFEIYYLFDLYGKTTNQNYLILEELPEMNIEGVKDIQMYINLESRKRINLYKSKIDMTSLGFGVSDRYRSKIIKYNTKLRKIPTESSKSKKIKDPKYQLIFDRITEKAYDYINNPAELKIRDKDLKILFTTEPSASMYKFQTRD